MSDTVVQSRAAELETLRQEVLRHVGDKVADGAKLIHEISIDKGVAASRVAAAMWTLVDDGKLSYADGGELRSTQ